jgi:hypothetical protein
MQKPLKAAKPNRDGLVLLQRGPGQHESAGHANDGSRTRNRLRTLVICGRYAPGSRLLPSEIARYLKVSTTPVREALSLARRRRLGRIRRADPPTRRSVVRRKEITDVMVT